MAFQATQLFHHLSKPTRRVVHLITISDLGAPIKHHDLSTDHPSSSQLKPISPVKSYPRYTCC